MKSIPFRNVLISRAPAGCLQTICVLSLLAAASLCAPLSAYAWGPEAHHLSTDWAVDALPPEVRGFFQARRKTVLEHCDDPEKWMKKDRYERMRHFIFLDKYGQFPYPGLPHSYKAAIKKYGLGHITRNGVLPWQIGEYSLKLTTAFKAHEWQQTLLDAAALSFYVADAHDPLHTTQNYDGQLSDHTGLETRFGIDLVNRYSHFFMFRPDVATKINDPTEYAFQMILEAHTWVDQIILADRQALDDLPGYTDDYYDRFYSRVGSVAMREISRAAQDVASYWYTAWLNAGQPALPK
jgi:hypothetical protein